MAAAHVVLSNNMSRLHINGIKERLIDVHCATSMRKQLVISFTNFCILCLFFMLTHKYWKVNQPCLTNMYPGVNAPQMNTHWVMSTCDIDNQISKYLKVNQSSKDLDNFTNIFAQPLFLTRFKQTML